MSAFDLLIRPALCFSVLYGAYLLFFRRNTFFTAQRIYLLLIPVVSVLFPFMALPETTFAPVQFTLPEVIIPVFDTNQTTAAAAGFTMLQLIAVVYALGVLIMSYRFVQRTLRTQRMLRQARPLGHGLKQLPADLPASAFSFGQTIYIHPAIPEEELPLIVAHEQVHIRHGHSIDRIYYELLCVVCWFNPLYRLAAKSLAETHEFIADQQACGNDAVHYKRVLVAHILGLPSHTLVHLFAEPGSLKKRLLMMNRKRTARIVLWSYLAVIPLMGGMLALNSFTFVAPAATLSETDSGETADKPAEFKGGQEAMMQYLAKNITYPADAAAKKIGGMVFIGFTVEANGKITGAHVKKSVFPSLDAEALRVISAMPDWNAAESNGKMVKSELVLPVKFKLD
jgi:TonB family protein